MTPEERLTKIENAIQALTEVQARHESEIEKQNAGIRDLIVVSRSLIDSENRAWEAIRALSANFDALSRTVDAMGRTVDALGGKVDKLSDSVDRFLRGLQKPNGNP